MGFGVQGNLTGGDWGLAGGGDDQGEVAAELIQRGIAGFQCPFAGSGITLPGGPAKRLCRGQ